MKNINKVILGFLMVVLLVCINNTQFANERAEDTLPEITETPNYNGN